VGVALSGPIDDQSKADRRRKEKAAVGLAVALYGIGVLASVLALTHTCVEFQIGTNPSNPPDFEGEVCTPRNWLLAIGLGAPLIVGGLLFALKSYFDDD
jgi:hypothetical protein